MQKAFVGALFVNFMCDSWQVMFFCNCFVCNVDWHLEAAFALLLRTEFYSCAYRFVNFQVLH